MLIHINLQKVLIRHVFFAAALVILGLLVKIVGGEFIVGTLSDKRTGSSKELVASAIRYFPSSARLLARSAELEMTQTKVDFESAERHIEQAIKLSPNNFKYQLLMAEIRDARGDQAGAEQALNQALRLAPNYSEVHWKTANFLARQKRIADSIEHFRIAADANPALFASTLDLVSALSDKNILFLERIVTDNQKGQLKLALLLANQTRVPEAAQIFSKIDKETRLPAWESSSFFDALINKGFSRLAFDLWVQLKSTERETVNRPLFWNGDFETESDTNLAQFEWRIGTSDYARIGFDASQTHSGGRSLLFDFLGRDTTKLDNEVKHLIALRPGRNYLLEFYVRTRDLKTEEGPRVVVSDYAGKRMAQSDAIAAGASDWKRMTISFTAPENAEGDSAAVFISVRRQPRYSYDQPTRGQIWFDDFAINEVSDR